MLQVCHIGLGSNARCCHRHKFQRSESEKALNESQILDGAILVFRPGLGSPALKPKSVVQPRFRTSIFVVNLLICRDDALDYNIVFSKLSNVTFSTLVYEENENKIG